MKLNKLICPHCNKVFPIFVNPARWIRRKWYKSPDAKCPSCQNIFQIKISIKRLIWLLPIIIFFVVLKNELTVNHLIDQNLMTAIITGVLAGIISAMGIRLSYIVKYG